MRNDSVGLAVLAISICVCASARADVVLLNQTWDGTGDGWYSIKDPTHPANTEYKTYDNFQLGAKSVINSVDWTGGFFLPGQTATPTTIDQFRVQIFADNGGVPATSALATYSLRQREPDLDWTQKQSVWAREGV